MSTRTLPTLAAPLALFRIREGPDDQGMAHWLGIDLAAPRRLERMPYPDQHRGDFHERCRAMVAAIRCDVWALRWILGYYAARQACPGTPEVASWLLRGSHIARASLSPASDTSCLGRKLLM